MPKVRRKHQPVLGERAAAPARLHAKEHPEASAHGAGAHRQGTGRDKDMSYWITDLTLLLGVFPQPSPWLSWLLGRPCTCEEYGGEEAVSWVTCQHVDCSDVPSLQIVTAILDPPFCCAWLPPANIVCPPWFLLAA